MGSRLLKVPKGVALSEKCLIGNKVKTVISHLLPFFATALFTLKFPRLLDFFFFVSFIEYLSSAVSRGWQSSDSLSGSKVSFIRFAAERPVKNKTSSIRGQAFISTL